MIVAIDGPAGSGKSTTARRVAERLGWFYLDTGAMYRAAALAFMDSGRPITDRGAAEFLPRVAIDLRPSDDGLRVFLDGTDVTDRIRAPEVGDITSRLSALADVRARMVDEQRRVARAVERTGGVVIEGRDIGTVVFPEADVKVFLVASQDERARRRRAELAAMGQAPPLEEVARQIAQRDRRDEGRAIAPLRKAEDAAEVDTTGLTIDQQVEAVIDLIKRRQAEHTASEAG